MSKKSRDEVASVQVVQSAWQCGKLPRPVCNTLCIIFVHMRDAQYVEHSPLLDLDFATS